LEFVSHLCSAPSSNSGWSLRGARRVDVPWQAAIRLGGGGGERGGGVLGGEEGRVEGEKEGRRGGRAGGEREEERSQKQREDVGKRAVPSALSLQAVHAVPSWRHR
jgi:hypothetical protein